MKLVLDHTQRLNLHAVLGAQRGTVDDMRALWRLQDRIDLSSEEKKKINYRTFAAPNGMQQANWDLIEGTKEFDLTPDEFQRVANVVKQFSAFAGSDRRWLEPLTAQIEMLEKAGERRSAKKSDAAD